MLMKRLVPIEGDNLMNDDRDSISINCLYRLLKQAMNIICELSPSMKKKEGLLQTKHVRIKMKLL